MRRAKRKWRREGGAGQWESPIHYFRLKVLRTWRRPSHCHPKCCACLAEWRVRSESPTGQQTSAEQIGFQRTSPSASAFPAGFRWRSTSSRSCERSSRTRKGRNTASSLTRDLSSTDPSYNTVGSVARRLERWSSAGGTFPDLWITLCG